MQPDDFELVYITTPDLGQARAIGRAMVEARLAACANVIEGMQSIYRWEGELCEETECILLLKTKGSLVDELTRVVQRMHPYECPCIVSVPLRHGSKQFLDWLEQETMGFDES